MSGVRRFERDSLCLVRTPVSAIFSFAPKIDNRAIAMLHCLFFFFFFGRGGGDYLPFHHVWASRRAHD